MCHATTARSDATSDFVAGTRDAGSAASELRFMVRPVAGDVRDRAVGRIVGFKTGGDWIR